MEQQRLERRDADRDIDDRPSPELLAVLELCGDARASDHVERPAAERRERPGDRRVGERRNGAAAGSDADARAVELAAKVLAFFLIPTLLVVGRHLRSA